MEEKKGRHEIAAKSVAVSARLDNLRILADLTQQLYLGMPSYDSYIRDKARSVRATVDGWHSNKSKPIADEMLTLK